ncbi:threonyl-tRNA synthetase [Bacillus velezensis]|nr:His/Gly/Thr/Pro-type tRNA ligase C-terminal domain-containing protein [Bacillus velezensis]NOL14744.1 threonyl-tRNA synthetase [Bacillus velezensis]UQX44894.1 His/Gly/Thr/Pro-type tRNA ligase C-terminal domain-containing protein [Bacillus velezensis]
MRKQDSCVRQFFFVPVFLKKKAGIRAELDQRDEKLGYKIREAQMKKIPYMAVVGDQECRHHSVHVRQYGRENTYEENVSDFIPRIIRETKQKIEIQEK